MQYWKAHYRDALHDTDLLILNTEEDYCTEPLSFTLDGVTFRGTCPWDFHLEDEARYDEAREKFRLLKWGGHNSKYNLDSPYLYDLQRYACRLEIPVSAVRKRDDLLVPGALLLAFQYDEPDKSKPHCRVLCDDVPGYRDEVRVSEFALCVDGRRYESRKGTLYFEAALNELCGQMKDDYYLKCCFTCQYSDYSPYGNDDYGLMLCYRRHKDDCLRVHNKQDYFCYLEGKDFDGRQETWLCGEYRRRSQTGGYRGFVDGV